MSADHPRKLWVDRPRDNATCGFSERPDDAPCGALAVEHGVVGDPFVALFACDRHKPCLVRNADWHHGVAPACRNPKAIFTFDDLLGVNFCYVPDEPSEESSAEHGLVIRLVSTQCDAPVHRLVTGALTARTPLRLQPSQSPPERLGPPPRPDPLRPRHVQVGGAGELSQVAQQAHGQRDRDQVQAPDYPGEPATPEQPPTQP